MKGGVWWRKDKKLSEIEQIIKNIEDEHESDPTKYAAQLDKFYSAEPEEICNDIKKVEDLIRKYSLQNQNGKRQMN